MSAPPMLRVVPTIEDEFGPVPSMGDFRDWCLDRAENWVQWAKMAARGGNARECFRSLRNASGLRALADQFGRLA